MKYLWKQYLDKNYLLSKFPPKIANFSNPFDFTQHIFDDFPTFMMVYFGSYPTAKTNNKVNEIWRRTANEVFNNTLNQNIVKAKGLFDINIIDCSFDEMFMDPTNLCQSKDSIILIEY